MAILFSAGRFKATDKDNDPIPGAFLSFYATLTSTFQPIYTDSTLTTVLTNPVKADANGLFPEIWLDDSLSPYKVSHASPDINDSTIPGSVIWTIQQYNSTLSASALVALINPITEAETMASITPVDFSYSPGHLYRYGVNVSPGTTDMSNAVKAWLSLGGNLTMPVPETVMVSGSFTLLGNTTLNLVEGMTFKTNTAGVSLFKATSQSNIRIAGGKFLQTANSATAHVGLIELNGCSNCTIEDVEFVGAQWAAVLLAGSSNCIVRDNYIHDSLGLTVDNIDSHDISCYGNSSNNVITANQCYGGITIEHGIMIQDPGSNTLPLRNTVYGNRIGAHKSYGILNYMIDHANTYNTIENNEIEGIIGSSQSGNSGAGIYNQGAGGTIIANNTIRNCCISTSSNSLTPAGIALSLDATMEPVTVIGNNICDMANWYGIEVVNGPANIVGNTIRFSSAVSATNTNAIGIYANAASNVNIHGNFVSLDNSINPGTAIFAFANGANISNISICNNFVNAFYARGIRVDSSGAFTTTNIVISGNTLIGGTGNAIPLQVTNLSVASITGNVTSATTLQALDVSACISTRIANNVFATTGTLAVNIAGTCTGSYYDKSNAASTSIKNAATGMICEQLGSATPATGFNSAVGDRIEQSIPVVGNPKGWRCTVAGNARTWVSEGNL